MNLGPLDQLDSQDKEEHRINCVIHHCLTTSLPFLHYRVKLGPLDQLDSQDKEEHQDNKDFQDHLVLMENLVNLVQMAIQDKEDHQENVETREIQVPQETMVQLDPQEVL